MVDHTEAEKKAYAALKLNQAAISSAFRRVHARADGRLIDILLLRCL